MVDPRAVVFFWIFGFDITTFEAMDRQPNNISYLSPHYVKAEIQNALSRLERSLLLDRVAPQLQQKSEDTFAL